MKFSIQEEGKEKQIFYTFKEASQETSIPITNIWRVLKRKTGNIQFKRKDGKVFFIQEVSDVEPLLSVDGVDFFDLDDLCATFGISQTVFLNQILKKQKHFLDSQEISHKVTWMQKDFEIFIDNLRKNRLHAKLRKATKRTETPLAKAPFDQPEIIY